MSDKKEISRREALRTMGSLPAVSLLVQIRPGNIFVDIHSHALVPSQKGIGSWTPKFFNSHQNETVTVISEMIIPQTDTPGAKAAKVNEFIDFVFSEEAASVQKAFLRGLGWIDRKSNALFGADFVDLKPDQQTAILTIISSSKNTSLEDQVGVEFFKEIKARTVFAYYTSEIGIHQELQYKGNGYLAEFPGCTHPEHLDEGTKPGKSG